MRVALFPDTNVALHFLPFEQIDWCALAQAEDVTLVLSSAFLRELDDKKNSGPRHIKPRAKRFSSWLDSLQGSTPSVRDRVTLEIRVEEPELSLDFAQHGLLPTVNDDRHIASMRIYRDAYPDIPCKCITADHLMMLKARAHGFEVLRPPEDARQRDEPDERDQELRALRDENVKLQRRISPQPQFKLTFGDLTASHLLVRVGRLRVPDDAEIEELLDTERSLIDMQEQFSPLGFEKPSRSKVEQYVDQVRAWLPGHCEAERQRMLTTRVDELTLHNVGDGNGEDIEITLTFPPNVYVAERRVIDREPKAKPPKGRNRLVAFDEELLRYPRTSSDALAHHLDEMLASTARHVAQQGPNALTIFEPALKHHDNHALEAFDLWFESADDVSKGATVEFRIHASTPPVVEGKLHLVFELADWGLSLDPSRPYPQRRR